MECKLRVSIYCKKRFKEVNAKYINNVECCSNCFYLMKDQERVKRNGYS